MFRYKPSLNVSHKWQGYIYYVSALYPELPAAGRKKIQELCRKAGREHCEALLEYLTTEAGTDAVCVKHHLSPSTLRRAVRRYYEIFPHRLL